MTDQEFDKINALKSLSVFLPLKFSNGSRVDGISICCSVCKKGVIPENIRTHLVSYEYSVAMEAFAICYDCHMITSFKMRLSDDGNMLVANKDGTWTKSSYANPPSGWSSFRSLLAKWRRSWIF